MFLAYLRTFLWGLAEATLFFIVPDISISMIAARSVSQGVIASLIALAGALIGGTWTYFWGKSDLDRSLRTFLKLPAIRKVDLERVYADLEKYGLASMVWGPLLGIPYKIYAAYAHRFSAYPLFFLVSIPARLVRFLLVAWVTPRLLAIIAPQASPNAQTWLVILFWSLVYVGYFFLKRKRKEDRLPREE